MPWLKKHLLSVNRKVAHTLFSALIPLTYSISEYFKSAFTTQVGTSSYRFIIFLIYSYGKYLNTARVEIDGIAV